MDTLKKFIILVVATLNLLIGAPTQAFEYKIEIPLPGMPQTVSDPAAYIRYFFIFGLGLVGFLAVGAIVVGGIMYMTGGTVGKVEKARQIIWGAVTGVVLLLCSYLLLYTIDPSLVNLSPLTLEKYDIPKLVEQYDLSSALIQGKTAAQITDMIKDAKLAGSGSPSCSITNCGSQVVQGKTLSTGAAAKYQTLRDDFKTYCEGCDLQLTSTVDGQHASRCHNASDAQKGGSCADFVVTATDCGGSIKLCSPEKKEFYINMFNMVARNSKNISSCLNEYKIAGSQYTTGGHFHCNF